MPLPSHHRALRISNIRNDDDVADDDDGIGSSGGDLSAKSHRALQGGRELVEQFNHAQSSSYGCKTNKCPPWSIPPAGQPNSNLLFLDTTDAHNTVPDVPRNWDSTDIWDTLQRLGVTPEAAAQLEEQAAALLTLLQHDTAQSVTEGFGTAPGNIIAGDLTPASTQQQQQDISLRFIGSSSDNLGSKLDGMDQISLEIMGQLQAALGLQAGPVATVSPPSSLPILSTQNYHNEVVPLHASPTLQDRTRHTIQDTEVGSHYHRTSSLHPSTTTAAAAPVEMLMLSDDDQDHSSSSSSTTTTTVDVRAQPHKRPRHANSRPWHHRPPDRSFSPLAPPASGQISLYTELNRPAADMSLLGAPDTTCSMIPQDTTSTRHDDSMTRTATAAHHPRALGQQTVEQLLPPSESTRQQSRIWPRTDHKENYDNRRRHHEIHDSCDIDDEDEEEEGEILDSSPVLIPSVPDWSPSARTTLLSNPRQQSTVSQTTPFGYNQPVSQSLPNSNNNITSDNSSRPGPLLNPPQYYQKPRVDYIKQQKVRSSGGNVLDKQQPLTATADKPQHPAGGGQKKTLSRKEEVENVTDSCRDDDVSLGLNPTKHRGDNRRQPIIASATRDDHCSNNSTLSRSNVPPEIIPPLLSRPPPKKGRQILADGAATSSILEYELSPSTSSSTFPAPKLESKVAAATAAAHVVKSSSSPSVETSSSIGISSKSSLRVIPEPKSSAPPIVSELIEVVVEDTKRLMSMYRGVAVPANQLLSSLSVMTVDIVRGVVGNNITTLGSVQEGQSQLMVQDCVIIDRIQCPLTIRQICPRAEAYIIADSTASCVLLAENRSQKKQDGVPPLSTLGISEETLTSSSSSSSSSSSEHLFSSNGPDGNEDADWFLASSNVQPGDVVDIIDADTRIISSRLVLVVPSASTLRWKARNNRNFSTTPNISTMYSEYVAT